MSALADPVRSRMLVLLEKHELTVSELCAVLQMPQSSVSRQLKTLSDDSWVQSRRDGTSRFYSMALDELVPAALLVEHHRVQRALHLEADPRELSNFAGQPAHAAVEAELLSLLLRDWNQIGRASCRERV